MMHTLLAQANDVVVRVIGVFLRLDHGNGHVGTVVGYALKIRQKVIVDKSHFNGTDPGLQAFDIAQLHS